MASTLKPLSDKLAVTRVDAEQKTPGGIVLPDTAKEKPQKGKVVAVGPGKALDNGQVRPMSVKVGDIVLFGKYSGTEVKLGDQELLIMREEDIMGILQD